jgi:hypothetical protein
MTKWETRLKEMIAAIASQSGRTAGGYASANAQNVEAAVSGRGPDSPDTDPALGARAVCNIPSAHVPAFCDQSKAHDPQPYKNGYNLGNYRLGDRDRPPKTREIVDEALPLDAGVAPDRVYFAAVELNGVGVRFYGDFCFVLNPDQIPENTKVLESNSYDLVREPLRTAIDDAARGSGKAVADERSACAETRAGAWRNDLGAIAAIKVIGTTPAAERRLTMGAISEGILSDEDYIEVLKVGSFSVTGLQEVRLNAADVALESRIGSDLREGNAPSAPELEWRERRRDAVAKLREAGVQIRIVTTTGRVRS